MVCHPIIPRTHEGVLHNGELILIVAQIAQKSFYQTPRNSSSSNSHWPFYCHPLLITSHLWHQVIARVDHLSKPRKSRTVSNKIRTHADSDVNRNTSLVSSRKNKIYVGCCFICKLIVFRILISKKFFKLIDGNENIFPSFCLQEFRNFNQSVWSTSQHGANNRSINISILLLDLLIFYKLIGDRACQICNWCIPWTGGNNLPVWACLRHETSVQNRNQTAIHQTRFTTSRIPHYGNGAILRKFHQNLIHLTLAAKEKMAFL